jgi:superfamily II DNA/RNA helicase
MVAERQKRDALTGLLRSETVQNAIVFCNRKKDVKLLLDHLKRDRFNVAALHGDMEQSERLKVLDSFKSGETTLLVASDVAARGLDIPSVSHVFNFDVPIHADDYIHRIGRTGRAGRTGSAFTFATPKEMDYVEAIEKLTSMSIPRHELVGKPSAKPTATTKTATVPAPDVGMAAPTGAAPTETKKPASKMPRTRRAKPAVKTDPAPEHTPENTDKVVDADSSKGWGDHVPAFFRATSSR